MTRIFSNLSLNKTARIAGVFYLVLAITGAFGLLYVPSQIMVEGDAAATAKNILDKESLFRLGLVSNLVGQVSFLFVGVFLYRLFKDVSKILAQLLLVLVVASVPIALVNVILQAGALVALSGADYLKAFEPNQLNNLAMLFLELSEYGVAVVSLFWGLWLLPFGLLVYRSGFFPKILGILLLVTFLCYIIDSFTFLLFPDSHEAVANIIAAPMALGEILTLLWILIRGVKQPA